MKGKQLGGKARAASLTPMRRKEIAIKASKARSLDKNFNVTHGSENNSLSLAFNIELHISINKVAS